MGVTWNRSGDGVRISKLSFTHCQRRIKGALSDDRRELVEQMGLEL